MSNVSQSATALSDLSNRTAILGDLTTASDHLPIVADYIDTVTDPVGPHIGGFAVSPTMVTSGNTVTLTASSVTEFGSGTVTNVNFYRESNGIAGFQAGSDTLVGSGTQSGQNWTLTASTTGLGGGVYTLYALATDNGSLTSDVASTLLTVNGPSAPTIGSMTVSPTSVAAGARSRSTR